MQSRLPDINTSFNTHRKEFFITLARESWTQVIATLYAWNGLLPNDYRIKVSTELYNEKVKEDTIAYCKHCAHEHKYEDIKIFNLLLPLITSLAANKAIEPVWICSECKEINTLLVTKIVHKVIQQPYYAKIVPLPPERKLGLTGSKNFSKNFKTWALNFMVELEAQTAQYRDDYQAEGEGEELSATEGAILEETF